MKELSELTRLLQEDPDLGADRLEEDWKMAYEGVDKAIPFHDKLSIDQIKPMRNAWHSAGHVFYYNLKGSGEVVFSGDPFDETTAEVMTTPDVDVEDDPFSSPAKAEQREEVQEHFDEKLIELKREHLKNYTRTLDDMASDGPMEWILQRMLPREGLAQLYAPSYSGKTICVVDLVCHMAVGKQWFHGTKLRTKGKPMRTLYIGAEGGRVLRSYFEGWYHGNGVENWDVLNEHVEIRDGAQGKKVLMDLGLEPKTPLDVGYEGSYSQMVDHIKLSPPDKKPALVVFDTQIDLLSEANENDATEYGRLLGRLQMDSQRLGCMFFLVHHTKHAQKGEEARERGSSAQKGKVDTQLALDRVTQNGDDDFQRVLKTKKVKGSSVTGKDIHYKTEMKEIQYTDDDGNVVMDEYGDPETYEVFWASDVDDSERMDLIESKAYPKLPAAEVARIKTAMMAGKKYSTADMVQFLNAGSRNSAGFQSAMETLIHYGDITKLDDKGVGGSAQYSVIKNMSW